MRYKEENEKYKKILYVNNKPMNNLKKAFDFERNNYKWGVYEEHDSIHVVPVDGENIINNHELSGGCYCNPIIERGENKKTIYKHNI